jgi:hypothetical protein
MTRSEGHLVLAGIRVLRHLREKSPTPEELAEFLEMSPSAIRLQLAFLADLGAVALVKSAFEDHAEVRDHRQVDTLPAEGGPDITKDLEDFDRRKQEEAEKMSNLFESGEHEKKRQGKLDRMAGELRDFRKKKPENPFGDD